MQGCHPAALAAAARRGCRASRPGSGWSPGRAGAGWCRCTGWPRSPGMAGMRRPMAGGGAVGPVARGQPGARPRGVRGGPGHGVAVGSGAGGGRGGRAGPGAAGPEGASKLTPELAERIARLDAAGAPSEIAAATGVSTSHCAQRAKPGGGPRAGHGGRGRRGQRRSLVAADDDQRPGAAVPVLPDPVPRDGALARWGYWARAPSRCSPPAPGIRWPGCCWRCPPWRAPGCSSAPVACTAGHPDGYYGLAATLLTLVFLALAA